MSEAPRSNRLMSLDAFRGATIALMILVNNPGSWSHIYWPLDHAEWDGWTPTDFVFPFFLFIVGVAMTFSFDKRLHLGQDRGRLFAHVVRRSITIIFLGFILMSFPNLRLAAPYLLTIGGLAFLYATEPVFSFGREEKERIYKIAGMALIGIGALWFIFDFQHFQGHVRPGKLSQFFPLSNDIGGAVLRVPGVLQRIGLCYFFASAIMFVSRTRGRIAWTVGLLAGYYLIMKFIHAPAGYDFAAGVTRDAPADAPFAGLLNDWIDVKLIGARHLYGNRPDPEGLLSTIPAIATVLLGILTGTILSTEKAPSRKIYEMAGLGAALLLAGWLISFAFPINKKLWSSSYVPFMAGWSLLFLAAAYYLIDVLGYKKWAVPLEVFGTNAIFVFFLSGILGRVIGIVKISSGGKLVSVKGYLYSFYTSSIPITKLASFAWALSYILLWLVLTYPLYRKRIFIKV